MRGIEILNVVIVVLSFVPFIYLFFRGVDAPLFKNKALQKKGIPATATIKQVADTGITINNNPMVKLTLELKDQNGTPYEAECRNVVSRLNPTLFKPGMLIQVKVDPKNKMSLAIDESAFSDSHPVADTSVQKLNAQELEIDLKRTQQIQDEVETSGIEAKAIIKTYTWLGANVNGNNPYVELEVEVLPDDIPAFSGKTRCVIGSANTNKFQPGSEVFVKYLQQNKSRIIITHS